MLNEMNQGPDVLSLTLSGTLSEADVASILERLEEALAREGDLNLLAEFSDDWSPSLVVFAPWRSRGSEWLKNAAARFKRVAVIADARWIRGAAWLESKVLYGVDYRIFSTAQRAEAKNWVATGAEPPVPRAFLATESLGADEFSFRWQGHLSHEDLPQVKHFMDQLIAHGPGLKLLADLRGYDGYDLGLLRDAELMEKKRLVLGLLSRYALVGAPLWLTALVGAVSHLTRLDLKCFGADEMESAKAWLQQPPGT